MSEITRVQPHGHTGEETQGSTGSDVLRRLLDAIEQGEKKSTPGRNVPRPDRRPDRPDLYAYD
ncbi:MAG: hypothetical protein AB1486_04510 [Planctomycetota bacterium]